MDKTLAQIGELLLESVPTIVFLSLLYFFYRILVHTPLQRVLGQRHDLTEGAIEKARADIAAAEARTAEYEQKLREARSTVFRSQEERRQAVLKTRDAAVTEARARAQQQVAAARAALEQDKAAAQTQLQGESERLASEIVRTVMQPILHRQPPVGGGR